MPNAAHAAPAGAIRRQSFQGALTTGGHLTPRGHCPPPDVEALGRVSSLIVGGPVGQSPTPSPPCRDCPKPLLSRAKERVQGDPRRPGVLPHGLQRRQHWEKRPDRNCRLDFGMP